MGSRNPLYVVVFRASSHVQMIPSERDLLSSRRARLDFQIMSAEQ
jgi:hypothetical protein